MSAAGMSAAGMSAAGVTPVVVRAATEGDLLHTWVGGAHGEYRPQLSAVMRSPTAVVLIAEINGEPVGRVTVDTTYADAGVSGFVVAARWRRHGVGTTLMDAAEAEALKQECDRLRLTVAKDNGPALALYARRGYERAGEAFSTGLRSPTGVVIHDPEPVWEMIKPVS
jgi:ribosomal protein S18 acetylase RimI-like enzyme